MLKVAVLVDDFVEELPGVILHTEATVLPIVLPLKVTDGQGRTLPLNSETDLIRMEELAEEQVEEFGEIFGSINKLTGFPMMLRSSDRTESALISVADRTFRLFTVVLSGGEQILPCYVPYGPALQTLDRWIYLNSAYRHAKPLESTRSSEEVSTGDQTLH